MEHKVLIADDSLTIQKVIKITLANEPFELHDCADAAGLIEAIKSFQPAMVLLDFNLSENKTGYDLCREIKNVNPEIGVLMLFGTFDTIDEGLLADCGCNYHIVKPFDGTKFINLCRALAADFESEKQVQEEEGDFSTGSIDLEEEASEEYETQSQLPGRIDDENSGEFGEEEWVVNQPGFQEKDSAEEEEAEEEETMEAPSKSEQNKLEMEVEDWGMEIPAVIGAEKDESAMELPGVIGEESSSAEETVLPASEDLEYPDMGATTEDNKASEEERPKSKLVPMEELSSGAGEIELEETRSSGGTDTEEGVKNLEEQIRDELEEEEDLWAADVIEESSGGEHQEDVFQPFDSESVEAIEVDDLAPVQPHQLREVKDETQGSEGTPSDFPADVMDEKEDAEEKSEGSFISDRALEEMAEKIQARTMAELEKEFSGQLTPLVERFVKEYCKEQIEKVAWEVIPDLAENIIKKEIQRISDSIMD